MVADNVASAVAAGFAPAGCPAMRHRGRGGTLHLLRNPRRTGEPIADGSPRLGVGGRIDHDSIEPTLVKPVKHGVDLAGKLVR